MISGTFCVQLESRAGGAAENLFNSIRNWLDYRVIELVSLVSAPAEDGGTAVDACFRRERDLALFCEEFGRRYFFSTP